MINLNVRFEEKDIVKNLGAKWNAKDKCWQIPDNASWHSFEQWIPEDVLKELSSVHELPFYKIFEDISENISFTPTTYKITGDVHSIFDLSDGTLICELIDKQNLRRVVRVVLDGSTQVPTKEDLLDKRVEVVGNLNLYKWSAQLQLKAQSVKVLGDCSRIEQIHQWEQECKDILRPIEEDEDKEKIAERRNLVFDFTNIGLIARENSKGYSDFINKLHVIPQENIHLKSNKMTVENMVKALKEFNTENHCQCICIVRGGGDPEELLVFSDPELLRAIKSSKIPVITGIAHTTDKLLCDRVSFYNANTPTGAADHLNFIWNKQHRKSKNYVDFKTKASKDINYWIKKCEEQESIIKDNELRIYELEQEI